MVAFRKRGFNGGNSRFLGDDGAETAARRPEAKIWGFAFPGQWYLADDPTPDGTDVGRQLTESGWRHAGCWGQTGSVSLELWVRCDREQYLAWSGIFDEGGFVLLPDIPSALAFLGLVLPLVRLAAACDADEDAAGRQRKRKGA